MSESLKDEIERKVREMQQRNCSHMCHRTGLNPWVEEGDGHLWWGYHKACAAYVDGESDIDPVARPEAKGDKS